MIIPGYQSGDDVLLLNTVYVPPHPKDDGKWSKGTLYLTYRDNKTGKKDMVELENPMCHTYITKPEFRNNFRTQRAYLPFNEVDRYEIPFNNIQSFLYKEIKNDGKDLEYAKIYEDAIQNKKKRQRNEVFKWRHSYYADYDICDYATTMAALHYNPTNTNVTKSFLDIESDIHGLKQSEIDEGAPPINAVTVIVTHNPDGTPAKEPFSFTLLLRNHSRYPQQEYFEDHLDEFIKQCHNEFDKKYGKLKYIIKMYDNEIDLLKNLFGLIHSMRSDFILIWNMSYDINAIAKRIQYLGYNPMDFFCHPNFKDSYMYYYLDNIYKNDFQNRTDYFDCTMYSRFGDQMLNYCGVRKGKADYGGASLDNIAHIELGAQKREYEGVGVDVTNGAIKEYWNFVLYNINDVLLQYGIDKKTEDIQSLFEQALEGGTRITKVLKQSVYLKNVFAIEYFNMGIVPRNNKNINYADFNSNEEDESEYDNESLAGALVGNPLLNFTNGAKIFGKPSMFMFLLCIDFDFASLYPNVKIKFQIAEHAQYGRLIIDMQVLPNENPLNDPKFMRGGKFVDDLEVGDWNKIGAWFGLKPICKYMDEFKDEVMKDGETYEAV